MTDLWNLCGSPVTTTWRQATLAARTPGAGDPLGGAEPAVHTFYQTQANCRPHVLAAPCGALDRTRGEN
jgi:hypothetical protein